MLLRRVSRTRFIDGQTGVVACCLLAAGCWLLVVAVERLQLQLSFRRQKNKNLPARIRPEANFCSNIADAFQKKKKGNGPFDDGNNQCGICLGYFQQSKCRSDVVVDIQRCTLVLLVTERLMLVQV